MPPLPTLRSPTLARLARALGSAPRADQAAALESAEALVAEIEPEREYPGEWLAFRVGGRREPEAGVEVSTGAAARRDLVALIEHVSQALGQGEAELLAQGGVRAGDLCARWRISPKTLSRLRALGLPARRATHPRARHVLVFMPGPVARFERAHAGRLAGAGKFTRMSPQEREALRQESRRLRRAEGLSITGAARRLAGARSVEGVRLVLARDEPRAGRHAGPIDERMRRVLLRALRRGMPVPAMARALERTPGAIRRALALARAEVVWSLDRSGLLEGPVGPTFDRPDASEIILAPPAVRQGLGAGGQTDLLAFVLAARAQPPGTPRDERARLLAYQYLRHDGARLARALDRLHPGAGEVDAIETRLRWAARIKAEILRPVLRVVLDTIENRLGGRVEELRAPELARHARACITAACHALDQADPLRAGRPAAIVALASDKALAEALHAQRAPGRAASLLQPGVRVPDWTLDVCPWQRWLDPDARIRAAVEAGVLDPDQGALLSEHFGWNAVPQTLAQIARRRGVTLARAGTLVRRGVESARRGAP